MKRWWVAATVAGLCVAVWSAGSTYAAFSDFQISSDHEIGADVWAPDPVYELPAACPPLDSAAPHGGYNLIVGTDDDDSLTGTEKPDLIFGLGGHDTIQGGNQDDCLVGGDGDDVIGGDREGENGQDVLLGGPGRDELDGGNGKDLLHGGEDDDTLDGRNGQDEVRGGTGDDVLYGSNSTDLLHGGDGTDTCTGGRAPDVYVECEAGDVSSTTTSVTPLQQSDTVETESSAPVEDETDPAITEEPTTGTEEAQP